MMKRNHSKKNSISQVISTYNTRTMLIAFFIYSIITLGISFYTSTRIMFNSLNGKTQDSAFRLAWTLKSYKNIITTLGTMPEFSDEKLSAEEKEKILQERTRSFGFIFSGLIDRNGIEIQDKISHSDSSYFQEAMNGNIVVTDPIVSKRDPNSLVLVCAGPIWKNGVPGGTIDSVVFCCISPEPLNATVRFMKNSRNSTAYIISSKGQLVASPDSEKVQKMYSSIRESEENPKDKILSKKAAIEKSFINDERNMATINMHGKIHAYSGRKIENSAGWVIILSAPLSDSMTNFFWTLIIMTIFGFSIILACHLVIKRTAKNISDPIQRMAVRLHHAAVGDFSSEVQINNSIEEMHIISEATQRIINRMAAVLVNTNTNIDWANIFSFFNVNDYEEINRDFEKSMHINLALYDKTMNKLFGTETSENINKISQNIYVKGRLVGKFIISPGSDCLLPCEGLEALIQCLALFLGKVFENVLNREELHREWQQNEMININNILSRTENISQQMKGWIDNTTRKLSDENLSSMEWMNITSEAKRQISLINESTEYARFTSLNTEIHENDYSVSELIKNIATRTKNDSSEKNAIIIQPDVNLPEKLFGDKEAIERAISRCLLSLKNYNDDSNINVQIKCQKEGLGLSLNTKIIIENPALSNTEIDRLKLFVLKNDHTGEALSVFEQKILSAVKLVENMNGSVRVTSFNRNSILNIDISIPQLDAGAAHE